MFGLMPLDPRAVDSRYNNDVVVRCRLAQDDATAEVRSGRLKNP